jgi:hypothetical protein
MGILCRQTAWTRSTCTCATTLTIFSWEFLCSKAAWTRSTSTCATIQAFLRIMLQADSLDETTHPCHNSDTEMFVCRKIAWTRSTSTRATSLAFKLSKELCYRQTAWTRSKSICATTLAFKLFIEFCIDRQRGPDPRPPAPQLWHSSFPQNYVTIRHPGQDNPSLPQLWHSSFPQYCVTVRHPGLDNPSQGREFLCVDRQCGPDPRPPAPQRGQPRVRHRTAQAQKAARAQSW